MNSLSSGPEGSKRKVVYFYDEEVGDFLYGPNHPMKPLRLNMTYDLINSYGLTSNPNMKVARPWKLEKEDLLEFHSEVYIDSLKNITYEAMKKSLEDDDDCPLVHGVYSFCTSCAGGSVAAAEIINLETADIAINWSGGLHHAKYNKGEGFCYVNDIVLAILELLRYHQRVLYVDIDAHHGDGVEEAFYFTDRVMTVSFHKYGVDRRRIVKVGEEQPRFFPGTGNLKSTGVLQGKYYSVNVPLDDGIGDQDYESIFKPIMEKVMEVYQPAVVVLQCGADSLADDVLGPFNLSIKGHAECVKYMRSFNVPMMLLGGGGYTIENVARCWCNETAVALGVELNDQLPEELTYGDYYYPSRSKLHYKVVNPVVNCNRKKKLQKVLNQVLQNLSQIQAVPSVEFHEPPPSLFQVDDQAMMQVDEGAGCDGMELEEGEIAPCTPCTCGCSSSSSCCSEGDIDLELSLGTRGSTRGSSMI